MDLGNRTATQIIFSYDDERNFPSQFTLEAFQDWDKPIGEDDKKIFKALREYLCNAWDEDKDFTLGEAASIGPAEAGTTSVFITLTDEIRNILDNLPRYFKMLDKSESLFKTPENPDKKNDFKLDFGNLNIDTSFLMARDKSSSYRYRDFDGYGDSGIGRDLGDLDDIDLFSEPLGIFPVRNYFAAAAPRGKIYAKSEPDTTRLFSQGVMVDCKKSEYQASVFDYSLENKYLLSEERIIKDFTAFTAEIGSLILAIDNMDLINQITDGITRLECPAYLEIRALTDENIRLTPDVAKRWKEAWINKFGAKSAIAVHRTVLDEDAANQGWKVIKELPMEIDRFFRSCGVTTTADIAGAAPKAKKGPEYELISLNEEQQKIYDRAYALFIHYFPSAKKFPVIFYRPLAEHLKGKGGHSGTGNKQYKEIWVSEESFAAIEMILEALIHEGHHCLLKADDYDRRFTQDGYRQLAKFILAHPVAPYRKEWRARIIQRRGIMIPHRFIDQPIHILVNGRELRLKIDSNRETIIMKTDLPQEVNEQISQNRKVTRFQNFGCAHLPEAILRKIPPEIILEIQ